jgi:hypothetical protein
VRPSGLTLPVQGRGEREKAWKVVLPRVILDPQSFRYTIPSGVRYNILKYNNLIEGMEVKETRCLLGLRQLDSVTMHGV